MPETGRPRVLVVGSCNQDITVAVERLPWAGQTVLGGDATRTAGGKGANQAVAVARLGGEVALVGCVGDDDVGVALRAELAREGVDTAPLRTVAGTPTGLALIAVDGTGENIIVVSPGANAALTPAEVAGALRAAPASAVTLVQFEVPTEAVAAAIRHAPGLLVVNPAPARPLPPELLARVDVLVPNLVELAGMTGAASPRRPDEVEALAARLDVAALVVTLGADGALVIEHGRATHLPAATVHAVDSTGAGDGFCGGLADALARGATLVDAARWAVRVAGRVATAWGAQSSLPTRAELGDGEPV